MPILIGLNIKQIDYQETQGETGTVELSVSSPKHMIDQIKYMRKARLYEDKNKTQNEKDNKKDYSSKYMKKESYSSKQSEELPNEEKKKKN